MSGTISNHRLFWNSVITGVDEVDTIQMINNGEMIEVLRLPILGEILATPDNEEENIVNLWKVNIEKLAEKCEDYKTKIEFLSVGVASLLLFIQQNWTGPDVYITELLILSYDNETLLQKQMSYICEELVLDGENICAVVQYLELLLLSRLILKECYQRFSIEIVPFWYLRSLLIHQEVLDESSMTLFDEMNNVMNNIKHIVAPYENADLTEMYLEFARVQLYYNYVQKSKLYIEKALESSGIEISLTGALGKRTKFQQEDIAQLTLKIDIHVDTNFKSNKDIAIIADLPLDIKLDDEVRLNKIKFKDDDDGEHPDLPGLHQGVILSVFRQTQKSQPKDRLADEELQPLISCILDKPKIWSIKLSALLFRSKLESNHKRSIERAMMQIQTLVDNINGDKPDVKDRLRYFFVSHQPPRWEIECTLARIMVCLGAFKSALDIYLKIQDWENVIQCYNILEMRQKAQEIIEQELKKNPTPKLWCYLGDVTEDASHYETAWKLSNERSSRAQRHWAMFYYNRREYEKCIKHFEISLEKNSLQSELWYRLGYAALHEEKWEVSANAYRRYCVLDPECFEAWNNLARCYCELNQKRRAWRAIQEALKVDYSNWRVWDNYMLVSADLREFDEVVRSYHQLLTLKEKHVDIPVLTALVDGFKGVEQEMEGLEESSDKETRMKDLIKFRDKLLKLFGRLTSQVVGQPELWYLYYEIIPSDSPQDLLKRQQLLLKSYNSTVSKISWVKTLESCKDVVDLVSKLIDASILVGQRSVMVSCQLSVRGCLALIKKEHPGTDMCDEIEKKLTVLEDEINKSSS